MICAPVHALQNANKENRLFEGGKRFLKDRKKRERTNLLYIFFAVLMRLDLKGKATGKAAKSKNGRWNEFQKA